MSATSQQPQSQPQPKPRETALIHPRAHAANTSTLLNTAYSTSLTTLPKGMQIQPVNSGRGQTRHTWPLTSADRARLQIRRTSTASAGDTAITAVCTPNLSSNTDSNPTPAPRTPRKIQFAGDILEDWLLADRVLGTTLTRSIIASELDSLPNSAPQTPHPPTPTPTPAKRNIHIRFAGSDSDILPATILVTRHRATQSAPASASHIAFLPLRGEHNSKGALKRKARSASPCPRGRRASASNDDDDRDTHFSDASTANDDEDDDDDDDGHTAELHLARMHAHGPSSSSQPPHAPSKSSPSPSLSLPFTSQLRSLRQKLRQHRLEKLSARSTSRDAPVHAQHKRTVKGWVSEQRELAAERGRGEGVSRSGVGVGV